MRFAEHVLQGSLASLRCAKLRNCDRSLPVERSISVRRSGRLIKFGGGELDGLFRFGDHAAGPIVTQPVVTARDLGADGVYHGHGPFAARLGDFEIEDFGLAELGPFRRCEFDSGAQCGDRFGAGLNDGCRDVATAGGGFVGGLLLGGVDFLQRRDQHVLAGGQFQNGFLSCLHLVFVTKLAGPVGRGGDLVSHHHGLRSFVRSRPRECVHAHNGANCQRRV